MDEFLRKTATHLRGYLHVLLGNLHDAEDSLQEVFLKYQAKGPPPYSEHARRWLFRTARNHAMNQHRSTGRRREREKRYMQDHVESLAMPVPHEAVGKKEALGKIQECLFRLSLELREALTLRVIEGLSYQALAAELGIAKSTASVRVREALVQLSRCFHGEEA